MKKKIVLWLLILALLNSVSYAQQNINFQKDTWHTSSDGTNRFYFGNNTSTYFGTGYNFTFRNPSDQDAAYLGSNPVGKDFSSPFAKSNGLTLFGYSAGRSITDGAQLEFVIPAGTDGGNMWGQGRIITIAGNADNNSAVGKMILGTRRFYGKNGASPAWFYGDDITIDGTGNVGIGTISPDHKLHIVGTSKFAANTNANILLGAISSEISYIASYNDSGNAFTNLRLYGSSVVLDGGNVGIGTTNTPEKLCVNGNIKTKKIIVTQHGWPDYVFKNTYKLLPLQALENYILKNKHLPDVPSAKEVAKNGIDLGDNQTVLLKKIEELTLYVIEQQKKMDILEREINSIKIKHK